MQEGQPDKTRHGSPFAAAFLSFVFPGLGQLYAGAVRRGLALAAAPAFGLALLGLLLVGADTRLGLEASLTSPTVLLVVLGIDALLCLYRGIAVVDAFRLAAPGRPRAASLPLAGLLAILLVLPLAHVALARYDLIAYDLVTSIGAGGDGGAVETATPGTTGTEAGTEVGSPEPTPGPTGEPWDGTKRLNILLIGVDHRPGGKAFNTDTMIVVSIDPVTRRVALLTLPRDTTGVPLPAKWRAASYYGGSYPGKINSLWLTASQNPRLFPGNDAQRGYVALKGALGALYQLDVQYYVEVDFSGFRTLVDTLGGVTVDVQTPVQDDRYPTTDDQVIRLYIAPGYHHMDGAQALRYARSRHGSSDFDRAQRQQRLILSMRERLDPASLLDPLRLQALVDALKDAVHTDIPPELFPSLITLADSVDLARARSLVFTPPYYQVECADSTAACYYSLTPKIDVIRRAVRNVFQVDRELEASRAQIADEGANVLVLDGSGGVLGAPSVSDYLAYLGMEAAVPTANGGRADRADYAATVITVYNGAEARLEETVRVLQTTFGVDVVHRLDPLVTADVIVITGSQTPKLTVPP
jgi:LCP family protein required for cell wall assembly